MSPALVMFVLRVLLALALYMFLGALLWMLWRDVRAAGQVSAARMRPLGRLVILETSLPNLTLGAAFPLLAITSLGRAPTNTVSLPDDTASLDTPCSICVMGSGGWRTWTRATAPYSTTHH